MKAAMFDITLNIDILKGSCTGWSKKKKEKKVSKLRCYMPKSNVSCGLDFCIHMTLVKLHIYDAVSGDLYAWITPPNSYLNPQIS